MCVGYVSMILLLTGMLWSIVSKAFLMSTNTSAILSCLSMELVILFVKEYIACNVFAFFLKLY